ncbi:L10-interacting MYB domain-containing protein [Euphorbia peplus]|nr:L10-interacting MYB domain-containing protein [Euphorbia peplus]
MGSHVPPRTNWTPVMERYFIDLMLDQMHRGNRMGHTFNKQAWTDMLTVFNAKFGTKYDRDIFKTRYTNLWKQYNDVKNILDQNGFSWDDARKMVIADDGVWDAFIKAHPDSQCYKRKSLMNFDDLCLIYAYTAADGRYSRSSHDLDLDDDIQGLNIGSLAPPKPKREKTDWTQEMDRYFIDLMLDQLKKGSGRDMIFSKQAWKHMLCLFNGNFGSQYGIRFLKKRVKKLFKYYCDIKSLLERKGFSWDERQQMVVADDAIWANCIEGCPDAHSYRRKTLLNYQDLSMIYGNQVINGHQDNLHYNESFEDCIVQFNSATEKDIYSSAQTNGLRPPWKPEMDRYLIDLLQDQALRGNKIAHDLTMEAWDEIIRLFNEQFGLYHRKEVLKNRYEHLRRQFSCINFLLEQNGFSWDENQEMVTAEDHIWNSFIKVHSDAQSYRNISVPSYHKLCVIFGEESSNGRYSPRTHNVDMDYKTAAFTFGEAVQCHANSDHLRTEWTPSMDRYFIDLMLKQVCAGDKIGNTFGKQAWIDMAMLFKEKFELDIDKRNLKSHYKSLGKLFDHMKNLLGERGFSWDEKHLVRAYGDIWDAYTEENPDVRSYRTEYKPNYDELHLIYGNSRLDEEGYRSRPAVELNKSHYLRVVWNLQMDRFFIDLMLEHVRQGSMSKQKFTKQAWSDISAKFSSEFGSQHDKDVLKSRFMNLRKLFNDMKNLLDRKGFAWDEARQMIIASNDFWNSYLKEYPDALLYRNRALPNYNDLFLIFGYTNNDGRIDYSSPSMAVDDCFTGLDVAADDMLSLANYDSLPINWTKAMEVYFIQLLLEQVLRGNKVGQTLNEEAWSWIIVSFNEKFGLLCDKVVAESWYLSLMEEYNNITYLLNQNGFAWDEIQQTVVANDNDWKFYLKEHPSAIKYKDRVLNSYSDLCVIYGHESPVGSLSYSGAKMEMHNNTAEMGLEFGSIFEDAMNPTVEEFETMDHRKKRKSSNSSTSVASTKVQRQKMENPEAVGLEPNMGRKMGKECMSIEVIVDALQAIPEMDDELFLEACKLLEKEKNAKVFVGMDVNQRRKWLSRNLY